MKSRLLLEARLKFWRTAPIRQPLLSPELIDQAAQTRQCFRVAALRQGASWLRSGALESVSGHGGGDVSRHLGLLQRLCWIASGYRLIPGGVVRPSPSFSYRATRHRLNGTGFAESAQIHMKEDSEQHDQGRDVVDHIRDRHQNAPKNLRQPHDHASDEICDAAAHNLPELQLLPGIEETDVGGLYSLGMRDILLDSFHPARIGRRPSHYIPPVERLQREEDHEAQPKPWMQEPGHRSPAKQRSKKAEDPRQIDPEA